MISEATKARLDREVAKYPAEQRQSAVMACLSIVQQERGWISRDAEDEIAAYLGMPPIAVYEVTTFYNMYNTKQIGKYKLVICTNLPCQLTHGETAATYLKETLGIGYNETTPCGTFTLKEGECMGACGDSPVMLVNDKRMCSFMSKEKIDALLSELRAEGKAV